MMIAKFTGSFIRTHCWHVCNQFSNTVNKTVSMLAVCNHISATFSNAACMYVNKYACNQISISISETCWIVSSM